jgi:PmbA protein
MTHSLADISQALLDAARKAGADTADAVVIEGTSISIDVREGKLEHAERAEGTDIGLRVLLGQRQAIVSASDTRAETMTAMAERAVAMAAEAPEDPYVGLADPAQLARDWDVETLELCDPSEEPAPQTLQDSAVEAETAGMAISGVSQVQSASAAYGAQKFHMAATNGFSGGYARTSRSISCVAIAGTGTGMERDYDGDMRSFQSDLRAARDIGTCAGERAVERLNARKPTTGNFPVLFDERISSSLIGHLLAANNGSSIARGSSWLQGALGEAVLPDDLSLIEDPYRARVSGSRPFDAEGLPTQRRAVVENGILTGWTMSLASARQLDMESSANAVRGPSSAPSPGNWNLALTQGNRSRADLIADMGTGLLVTSMIGSTINPTTGDYSRGASGFWVENGEITGPVNECTIAGNLRDMLRRIIPANDARTHLSRVVPSLLVEGMTLAGA